MYELPKIKIGINANKAIKSAKLIIYAVTDSSSFIAKDINTASQIMPIMQINTIVTKVKLIFLFNLNLYFLSIYLL